MARTSMNGHAGAQDEKRANGAARANGPDSSADVEKTDYSRWRLLDEHGRQTWHYLTTDEELKEWPQSEADRYHLGLDTVSTRKPHGL